MPQVKTSISVTYEQKLKTEKNIALRLRNWLPVEFHE